MRLTGIAALAAAGVFAASAVASAAPSPLPLLRPPGAGAPEHFAAFERKDTMKRKQFETGIRQIAQEGAIQIFHEPNTGLEEVIVGVVGVLQFDVLEYRLQSEYSTAVRRRALPYENIRWIVSDTDPATLTLTRDTKWVQDFKGNNLLLFGGEWNIAYTLKQNPGLELAEFSKN